MLQAACFFKTDSKALTASRAARPGGERRACVGPIIQPFMQRISAKVLSLEVMLRYNIQGEATCLGGWRTWMVASRAAKHSRRVIATSRREASFSGVAFMIDS